MIAADSVYSRAYRGVVLCYGAMGNPQGALKYMDALFIDKPDSAEVHYGMGCALCGLQKYDEAAKYFDKALKIKPDLAAAWNNRGSIYHFVARDYAKARQYYEKAIETGSRTGNAEVVKIARENIANVPREEDLKPLTLEEFLDTFIARADDSDSAGVRWLVLGQKANCEPALDWFLEQALQAASQEAKDQEKTAVALATLLAATVDRLKTEGKVISKYTEILSLDGENKEARAALAKIYYEKYRDAETLRQSGDMAYYKELILAFDDGAYRALLEKEGSLTLTTNPAADGYFVFRFVEGPDRRLVPAPFSAAAYAGAKAAPDENFRGIDPQFKLESTASMPLGKLLAGKDFNRVTQIENLRMPAGSYVILIQKPGFVDTRIPFVIERGQEKKLDAVKLLKDGDAPKGFVYVPKGEFIYGGDSEAVNSPKRSMRKAAGFLIAAREVTVGEYVKFLNYQESVRPGSAENYLPRKSTDSGFYWKKAGSQYQPSFAFDWPVLGVAQIDARLYCKWLTRANNDKWEFRLPEEWEWEKAARGVDGRFFPWGNYFDFSFCSMGKSREGRREGPDKVGSFPLDASVSGVEDMAGNVSEWTASFLGQEQMIALFKGAGWSKIEDKFDRCAARNGQIPEAVADDRGFGIAISIKE